MIRFFMIALIGIALAGCSAHWPDACPVKEIEGARQRTCSCAQLTVAHKDGLVSFNCDGDALPITIEGGKVSKLCR